MQNRAIKYRIYPSAEQKVLFAKTFGCCRKIWNLMLADKITYYQQTQKMLQTTPAQYKKSYPYLKEVDSLALANVQLHLQTAYKNFFRNKKTGFPKFKSAKRCRRSYTTNCQNSSIRIEDGRNYQKQQKQIARVYRHISNQRKDYLHKQSTAIAKQYAYVCVEDLNMRSLSNKGFGNGKATLDNGYGMFLDMLDYKLAGRGGKLVKVDKFFPSSQICHCCGCRNPEVRDLRIREWICPDCGTVHDRDTNAAKNIKTEGLRILLAA